MLAVGRLVPQKGFDVLIEAFRSEALASLDLVIAGEGFERARLVKVGDLGLSTRVRFLGSVGREHVTRPAGRTRLRFAVAGRAVRNRPSGGMAAGVAVVATAAGGVPEIVAGRLNGRLVGLDDPDGVGQSDRRARSRAKRSAVAFRRRA